MNSSYIFITVVVFFVLWFILVYNRFISFRNRVKEAWSDIDVQLKRRYNLIPNIVEAVKGYATHERQLLESVTQARAAAMGAQTIGEHAKAENMLSQTLKSLFAVTENYPDLKASQNFLELQRELRDTEDKIQAARRFYNTLVRDLNTAVGSFPSNLVARLFKFGQEEFFELEEKEQREPVKVSF